MGTETRNERLTGLNEGLRVRHIATSPLATCQNTDATAKVFGSARFIDFDQIPVTDGTGIIGVLERHNPDRIRPLDHSVLVSADDLLSHFIHTVHDQPYRLVVEGTTISGIVTWSDVLKLPVLVLGYSVMADLELAMNRIIQRSYGQSTEWLDLLDLDERKKILARLRKMQSENLSLPIVESADITHKAKVLHRLLKFRKEFDSELDAIVRFRNEVAHVKEPATSSSELKAFVVRFELAEAWLDDLNQHLRADGSERGIAQSN